MVIRFYAGEPKTKQVAFNTVLCEDWRLRNNLYNLLLVSKMTKIKFEIAFKKNFTVFVL